MRRYEIDFFLKMATCVDNIVEFFQWVAMLKRTNTYITFVCLSSSVLLRTFEIRYLLGFVYWGQKHELETWSSQIPSFQRIQASNCVLAFFEHY
jgi:hypothetical protein